MQRSAATYGHKCPLKHIVPDGAKGVLLHSIHERNFADLGLLQYYSTADTKALGCKLTTETAIYLKNPGEIRRKGLWRFVKSSVTVAAGTAAVITLLHA